MKTVHISILGCCSTRDTIEVFKKAEDIGKNMDIVVDKYVNNASILSVFGKPFSEEDYNLITEEASQSKASNFQHRKLDQEMKKSFFSFLREAKSDYFVVDMSAIRLPVFKVHDSVVTAEVIWQIVKDLPECKGKDYVLKQILVSDKTYPFDLPKEELRSLFIRYIDEVLKMYDEKNIIFVNLKNASVFVGKNGTMDQQLATKRFSEQEDELMRFAFEIAKQHCPKSYFIEELPKTIGDLDHWFGLHPLHYVNDVYRYYAESFLSIFKGKNKKEAEAEIKTLKDEYTVRLFSLLCDSANQYVLNKTNLLGAAKYPKAGMCALNGVSLKTYADFSFELEGEAFDATVFYLYSGTGNPIGDWSFVRMPLEPGKYVLKTGFNSDSHCHIDAVFFNDTNDKRWVWGNKSVDIELEHGYKYFLARVVIEKGAKICRDGLITLEKKDD